MPALALLLMLYSAPALASGFADAIHAHYRASEICLKSKTPSRAYEHKLIRAIENAATMFWPDDSIEAKRVLFVLCLTEGGGTHTTPKADPIRESYGPMHVKLDEAVASASKYGIPCPDVRRPGGREWFAERLKASPAFAVACAAGHLKTCQESRAGGGWSRAILLFKFGATGFRNLKTEEYWNSPIWIHYREIYAWYTCIERAVADGEDVPCHCLQPDQPPT